MIDAVRVALTALRSQGTPSGELAVVAIAGAPRALVGIDREGGTHLLLRSDDDDPPPTASEIATLAIDQRTLVVGGERTALIDVACLSRSVSEVFDHFIVAVLERLARQPSSPARALSEVLQTWKQFLVPAPGPPGRARLAAVFGELVVLLDVVRSDPNRRVDCWVGPFGGRHDIRRGATALEVKTTRAHTSRAVTIHGEDQLEIPEGGTLHLHLVRLEHVPGGARLVATLVDELLSEGVPVEALFDALSAASVAPSELAATESVAFDVLERLTVPVDDDTPRITAASFVKGVRPVGVIELTYVIDLDHSQDRVLDAEAYQALIHSLGNGP